MTRTPKPTRKGKPSHSKPAPANPQDEPEEIWLYGWHAVSAALDNPQRRLIRLVSSRNVAPQLHERGLTPETMDVAKLTKLLPEGAVHNGIAALMSMLEPADLSAACLPGDAARPVVILDHITDPQNTGAILRSAAAFGARAVVTTWRHSAPVTGALAKTATGALEVLPYVRVQNLARAMTHLREHGYGLIGLAEDAEAPLAEIVDQAPSGVPLAIVLGAEGTGLRQLTRETCDLIAKLPTAGPIASLNVSNAAAVALYDLARRR